MSHATNNANSRLSFSDTSISATDDDASECTSLPEIQAILNFPSAEVDALEVSRSIADFNTDLLEYTDGHDDHAGGNVRFDGGFAIDESPRTAMERIFHAEFPPVGGEGGSECVQRGCRSRGQENIHQDAGLDAQNVQDRESGENRYRLANIVREILRLPKKRGLIHEVVYFSNRERAFDAVTECLRTNSSANVFIVAWHAPNHIHVVHDCAGAEKRCKCSRLCSLRRGRRPIRVFFHGSSISPKWWENLLLYFLHDEREYLLLEVGGECRFRGVQIGGLQISGRYFARQEGLVAQGTNAFDICHTAPQQSTAETGGSSAARCGEAFRGGPGSGKGNKESKLLEFLKKYPCAPLRQFTNIPQYKSTPFYYWNFKRHFFRRMLARFEDFINDMPLHELRAFTHANTPLYNAPRGDVTNYYYSVERSVQIGSKLLRYQAQHNAFSARKFLATLHDIIGKHTTKCNTFVIVGEACAGKNYFFDAVLHAMYNFGQIGNFNKYQSFPLQEAINKRILLWNEPDIEVGQHETLKMLLGGDTLNVKVKYEDDAILARTPIIVLANQYPFPTSAAFQSRVRRYQWCAAPFLRRYTKKLHPAMIWQLWDLFNVNLTDDSDGDHDHEPSSAYTTSSEIDSDPEDTGEDLFLSQ